MMPRKGMGIISLSLLLFYQAAPEEMKRIYQPLENHAFYVPDWVIVVCSLAIALGVSSGGWRIMKTLGAKLYKIRPIHGFSAQACSSTVIYLSSLFGFPVSTTQIVSSSLLGAGSARYLGSVRWGVGQADLSDLGYHHSRRRDSGRVHSFFNQYFSVTYRFYKKDLIDFSGQEEAVGIK